MGYRPLSEYGVVGNDDRCALVGSDGAVDWCCFPTVDSPSVFGRLLDAERGGHLSVAPTDSYDSGQSYLSRTNILETTFRTDSGRATLVDFMPAGGDDRDPETQQELFRHLRCETGQLTVEIDCKPRFDYARADTRVEEESAGIVARGDGDALHLQVYGPVSLRPTDGRAVGTVTLEAGDSVWFVVQYDHVRPTSPAACRRIRAETVAYWRQYASTIESRASSVVGDDPWLDEVVRSALVLKLLTNDDTSAVYAAPTTSLPEVFGGRRNWDYRYNWIRDSNFAVQALANLGDSDAADRYYEWLLDVCHDDPAEIQPLYGAHGETDLSESFLDHLDGYRFSAPVRVGNLAAEQRQLDAYGILVQGLYEAVQRGYDLSEGDWQWVRRVVDHVCDVWDEPDSGIWEFRVEPRHYVHSKLLCWVALDRGIELAARRDGDADTDRWTAERASLRAAIEDRGYSETAGSFVQHFDTDETLDAACLLIPLYEFLPPGDGRVQSTLDAVVDGLLTDDGLVRRAKGPDIPPAGRGAFLFCSFWLVDALVLADRVDEARECFTTVLDHVDSPALLPERIDPATGEFLGNYPQAFSHTGLINSVIYLGSVDDDDTLPPDAFPNDRGVHPLFRF
ncbi:glycoside hydrolase family 15 protein [Halobacterium jilantaiense]|uniref:Glucoamylase (Glucan-1,4-alpha-glucosidase), GH15 family n=1 Tax=Halobacterium jilantaiense TaxID=355548 RepID=A0A1I0QJU3_9EURY|nr:glycoside hydrolase family 15 protein [Halobacterium jilantaiense]SEW27391.1 Glucoamylase (glucan-1,4-alpha-glucosidase), GH15 family [Halobacterium jilantaiense]